MSQPEVYLIQGGEGKEPDVRDPAVPQPDRAIENLAGDLRPMQEAVDLPDLFAALAQSVTGSLKADACLISLYDESKNVIRDVAASVVRPARLNVVAEEYDLNQFPLTREVMETGEPIEISVSDPDGDRNERALLDSLGFARVLINRFNVDGKSVGTLEVYRVNDRAFRSDDAGKIDVLSSFAANAYSRIQLAAKLEIHYTETIEALVSALEARDPYTEAHASRIRDLAVSIAIAMQLPYEQRRAVRLGAILHDVGKIGISDAILLKPGPLTDEEWAIMRTHPEIGERMLKSIDFLAPALPIVRHHHERWAGKGYPDGLAEKDIPIGARIVAVCDAFDAMTSDRPYRKALALEEACDELTKNSGTQFDPDCVDLIVDVVSQLGDDHLEGRFVRFAG
jgi:HD-GYP domain-containing protein (c-di-GMP phosphodiesterase class II)